MMRYEYCFVVSGRHVCKYGSRNTLDIACGRAADETICLTNALSAAAAAVIGFRTCDITTRRNVGTAGAKTPEYTCRSRFYG